MHIGLRHSVIIGVVGLSCVLLWGFRARPVNLLAEEEGLFAVRHADAAAATAPMVLHAGGGGRQRWMAPGADDTEALADVIGIGSHGRGGPNPMSYTPPARMAMPLQHKRAEDAGGISGLLDDDRADDNAFEGLDEALPGSWGWLADDVGETRRDSGASFLDDRTEDAPRRLFEDENDDMFRSRFGVGGPSDDASAYVLD